MSHRAVPYPAGWPLPFRVSCPRRVAVWVRAQAVTGTILGTVVDSAGRRRRGREGDDHQFGHRPDAHRYERQGW